MSKNLIPIQNIFYLLCYAFNRYQEGERLSANIIDSPNVADLFATMVVNGTNQILRRGLDRGYVPKNEDLSCLRGKISISNSLKNNSFLQARANCDYDEFEYNVMQNQIIKSTIHNLIAVEGLKKELKHNLLKVRKKLREIDIIRITRHAFRNLQLNKNNAYYAFMLKVCELIHETLLPEDTDGKTRFKDVLKDEKMMNRLFEEFVRNFFKKEQSFYSVKSEYIQWDGYAEDELSKAFLPSMLTDISLRAEERLIIIDTKYYKDPLVTHREKRKIHSQNLYQLFAYLENVTHTGSVKAEGILLYPTVKEHFDFRYNIKGHSMRACSINLNQDWKNIHGDLLGLTACL